MSQTAYIYWNADPTFFSLGPFTVRWYGLLFALAFILGYWIVGWMFRREHKPVEDLDRLLLYMMFGTVIGARLGHVLFYDPAYYFSRPMEILKIWEGGLASHGGAIGIFAALYLYARRRPDQPYLWLLDRVAVPTALGGVFIRLGNLFNSEILGVPTEAPWAFVFARVDMVPRHPAQLYESLAYGLIFMMLLAVYRHRGAATPRGFLLGLLLMLVFGARFIIEFVKASQAAYDVGMLSVGQWLSIPLVAAGAVLLMRAWRQGANEPGRTNVEGPRGHIPAREKSH